MFITKILLGLIGLGVVVFVHELGHFFAARLVGIDVEAFSIGWGKPLLKKKFRGVEYRLGMFPLGGYCKMRGENEFQEAWENRRREISPTPGTFFGANPFRRILVAFAGPLFNLLFAVLVLSVIWGAGFEVNTLGNRIILASELGLPDQSYPADEAGLETGDRIISINGVDTPYYHDIQENIAVNPEKNLALKVERDGTILDLTVRPSLEKSTGAGKIGVYFWTEPVLSETAGPARAAGLLPGDRILRVNGEELPYTVKMLPLLEQAPQSLTLDYERDGRKASTVLIPVYQEGGGIDLGLSYGAVTYKNPSLLPPAALAKGARETWKTLVVSLRSLSLLFRGIDLTQAVSGPVRISYMAGDIAAEAFGQGIGTGFRSMANFLSLISIALCVMNLLPLPVLDGGMILLFVVEAVQRKPLHPRAVSAFQTVGVVLIFGLMIFAIFGDILYLVRH
ncbi:MAG: site-2 protease family protein [Treponema sp.]|jgi:regulator of sigma E protease|nr:site-2 protease family protein [Treponema sp.]